MGMRRQATPGTKGILGEQLRITPGLEEPLTPEEEAAIMAQGVAPEGAAPNAQAGQGQKETMSILEQLQKLTPDELFAASLEEEDDANEMQQAAFEDALAKRKLGGGNGIDLSPAAAFVDSTFGTNISPAMQADAARLAQERRDIANLEAKTAAKAGGVGRGTAKGRMLQYAMERKKNEDIRGRMFGARGFDAVDKLQGKIEKDLTPYLERGDQFANMEAAINQGDIGLILPMMSQFARGISGEKGVLTDTDVARVFPNTGLTSVAKLVQYFGDFNSLNEVPPHVRANMLRLVELAKYNAAQQLQRRVQTKKNLYSKRPDLEKIGVSDTINDLLDEASNSPAVGYFSNYDKNIVNDYLQSGQSFKQGVSKQAGVDIKNRAAKAAPATGGWQERLKQRAGAGKK